MAVDKDRKTDGTSWSWAYLIPLMGLMIPIIAITDLNLTEVLTSTMAAVIAAIGAGTLAGRYLLGYQHQLQVRELEARREIVALETHQLTEAQRVLDLDDRLDELKPPRKAALPTEA
ncbi:MAG: hypothetical protein JJE47_14220 [Acidimicrobiia bacterium]|nr:hypothetical protein [Acidimicrobiia bacterium]